MSKNPAIVGDKDKIVQFEAYQNGNSHGFYFLTASGRMLKATENKNGELVFRPLRFKRNKKEVKTTDVFN